MTFRPLRSGESIGASTQWLVMALMVVLVMGDVQRQSGV
jgi:hypothetical protein